MDRSLVALTAGITLCAISGLLVFLELMREDPDLSRLAERLFFLLLGAAACLAPSYFDTQASRRRTPRRRKRRSGSRRTADDESLSPAETDDS